MGLTILSVKGQEDFSKYEQMRDGTWLKKKRTIVKGSGGKIVDRETLPGVPFQQLPPLPIIKEEIVEQEHKPSGTIISIMKTKELHADGLSVSEIASKMGKDEAWVMGNLAIADRLPKSAHDAISHGKFSRTAAIQLLFADPAKIEEIVAAAVQIADIEGEKL